MKYFTTLMPVVVSLCFAACSKEVSELPNNNAQVKVEMNNTERSGSFYAVRGPATGGHPVSGIVTWNQGNVNATRLSVSANSKSEAYSTAVTPLSNAFEPSTLATINVDASKLQQSLFTVHLEPAGGTSALRLEGTYTDNAAKTYPVIFQLNEAVDISNTISPNGLAQGPNPNRAITSIRFGTMLETIPETLMTEATLNWNGAPIMITSSSNVDLYNYIKQILPGMLVVKFESE